MHLPTARWPLPPMPRGRKALSIETSINHLKPVVPGDVITATAEEVSLGHKLGIYHIRITRGEDLVALFKGIVYRKEEEWNV
jgi:acyl-CoA thioesterase